MAKILQFKKKFQDNELEMMFRDLDIIKELYIKGHIDKIVILCQGNKGKFGTSNGLKLKEGKEICKDMILNYKEYFD